MRGLTDEEAEVLRRVAAWDMPWSESFLDVVVSVGARLEVRGLMSWSPPPADPLEPCCFVTERGRLALRTHEMLRVRVLV